MAAEEEWEGAGKLYGVHVICSEWLGSVEREEEDERARCMSWSLCGLYICIGEVGSDLIECHQPCYPVRSCLKKFSYHSTKKTPLNSSPHGQRLIIGQL